jgi:hypothetical protein
LLVARLDVGQVDRTFADARDRVANDSALCLELFVVRDVLQLARAAAIDAIVIADSVDALRRRSQNLLNIPTGEALA